MLGILFDNFQVLVVKPVFEIDYLNQQEFNRFCLPPSEII